MIRHLFVIPLLAISLSACQPTTTKSSPSLSPSIRLDNGLPMAIASKDLKTPQQVIHEIAKQNIVLIGESHDRYDHHLLQLRIIKAMHADAKAHGQSLTIGMEFFQRPFQAVLDDYINHRIDETEMLSRSEYFQRWRFDYRLYRPILRYAHEHRIRVLALNASHELTGAIREHGLQQLPASQREKLPTTIDQSNSEYRTLLKQVFDQHSQFDLAEKREQRFQRFVEVQLVWDETMAQTAAKQVIRNPNGRLVLLAGAGHMIFRNGIPDRLQRQIKQRPTVVLVASTDTLRSNAADYLINTQPEALPARGVMGIFMEEDNGKVIIQRLSEESPAHKAGARQGDIIERIDERPVTSTSDVRIALLDKGVGDTIILHLKPANSSERHYQTELILGSSQSVTRHNAISVHTKSK